MVSPLFISNKQVSNDGVITLDRLYYALLCIKNSIKLSNPLFVSQSIDFEFDNEKERLIVVNGYLGRAAYVSINLPLDVKDLFKGLMQTDSSKKVAIYKIPTDLNIISVYSDDFELSVKKYIEHESFLGLMDKKKIDGVIDEHTGVIAVYNTEALEFYLSEQDSVVADITAKLMG